MNTAPAAATLDPVVAFVLFAGGFALLVAAMAIFSTLRRRYLAMEEQGRSLPRATDPVAIVRPIPPEQAAQFFTPAPVTGAETGTAPAPAPEAVPEPAPPVWPSALTLAEIASGTVVLMVGNRGSGKTTLLQALLRIMERGVVVFDPHNTPDKWPEHTEVIGGGRKFRDIYWGIRKTERIMQARAERADAEKGAVFTPFVIASDEWGSVSTMCDKGLLKEEDKTGALITMILKEGRKFGLGFFASAHGDTVASLGCEGDKEAFIKSFDWIIYMGAFGVEKLQKQFPATWEDVPYILNPEGGIVPLVVPAWSPTLDSWRLVDITVLDAAQAAQEMKRWTLEELAKAEGAALPEQPATSTSVSVQLTPQHLKVAAILAVKGKLSDRKLGQLLNPDRAPGGDGAVTAGKLRREVQELLGDVEDLTLSDDELKSIGT